MMWSRAYTLMAGLGVIALTNAVALVGVAYNRSGDPMAKLSLTQRELRIPYRWFGSRENSGLALSLNWRVWNERIEGQSPHQVWRYGGMGGVPSSPFWLDKAKMESLGFDTSASSAGSSRMGRERYQSQLSREVLLVLEMNGPIYQRSVQLAKEHVARVEAQLASSPNDKKLVTELKDARDALDWEDGRNSRLFVADVGLDPAVLRAKYSDATRYAIVRGQVRTWTSSGKHGEQEFRGLISGLSIDSINVPFDLRDVFGNAAQAGNVEQRDRAPFEAVVAFGRRFEPWLIEATKK